MKIIIDEKGKNRKEIDLPNGCKFGERLKGIRKAQGLSQKDVAERLGFAGHQAYARYETQDHAPKGEMLQKLAAALDVPEGALDFNAGTKSFNSGFEFCLSRIQATGLDGARHYLTMEDGRLAAAHYLMERFNEAGRRAALDLLELVCKIPEYKKK